MRLFLSFALLFLLLAGMAVFAYFFWDRILKVFGITVASRQDDLEAAQDKSPAGSLATKGGGMEMRQQGSQGSLKNRPFGIQDSAGADTIGRQLSSDAKSSQSSNAPMIVVAADDTRRGHSIPYDTLEKACGNWADSKRIGSGGAAVVYRAELPRYGPVAVKRFHNKDGSGREWTRELEALSACRHPHILEIIGHADEGPENLIVMPLMEGGTLCEAMHKIWWATRVTNVGQVVRALSFLHGKGILHRDVKSSNILLDASLRHTRLADFGLAKDQVAKAGQKTHHGTTGVVVGSPGYMAPELMMRPATEKTDAYAFGVVLLEILTGLPAWDVDENGAVLTDRAVVNGSLVESLLDPAASWPRAETVACSEQAIALTLFDPSSRKTLAAMEQDPGYVAHLERSTAADAARQGGATALGTPTS